MSFTDIDFASRRRVPAWFVVGLMAAIALLAWGGQRYADADRALAAAKAQRAQQRQQLARATATQVALPPAPGRERVQAINQAIAALNVPWPGVLGAVESARPAAVQLMRVEPRPKDQLVLVTAQADDIAALLDFMNVVAGTAPFTRVVPIRQEGVTEAGVPRKQATFEARWETAP